MISLSRSASLSEAGKRASTYRDVSHGVPDVLFVFVYEARVHRQDQRERWSGLGVSVGVVQVLLKGCGVTIPVTIVPGALYGLAPSQKNWGHLRGKHRCGSGYLRRSEVCRGRAWRCRCAPCAWNVRGRDRGFEMHGRLSWLNDGCYPVARLSPFWRSRRAGRCFVWPRILWFYLLYVVASLAQSLLIMV